MLTNNLTLQTLPILNKEVTQTLTRTIDRRGIEVQRLIALFTGGGVAALLAAQYRRRAIFTGVGVEVLGA